MTQTTPPRSLVLDTVRSLSFSDRKLVKVAVSEFEKESSGGPDDLVVRQQPGVRNGAGLGLGAS